MAKVLDFNALQRPTLELVMPDENKTKLRLVCPTERLIERLEAGIKELTDILNKKDIEAIAACFELAADLINCNDDGIVVNAQELRDKYHLGIESLVVFYSTYVDFIDEIKNAKN
jgi:hypothetical protein